MMSEQVLKGTVGQRIVQRTIGDMASPGDLVLGQLLNCPPECSVANGGASWALELGKAWIEGGSCGPKENSKKKRENSAYQGEKMSSFCTCCTSCLEDFPPSYTG